MQRMYERLADEIRGRKGIPFTKVLQQAQAKTGEEKAAAASPNEESNPAEAGAESRDETPDTGI